jgi:phosphoglycerate dehydrogenase-like enzyme
MEPVHVLVSAKVTAEQLAAMRAVHPRLVIHGEPGGYAIMDASEVDHKGIDYPDERPDVDVAGLLRQAQVIIATRIPVRLLEVAPSLRWLQFTSAGVDHLWKPGLDAGTVTVTSSKGIHGVPIAEFVMGALLHLAKDFERLRRQQRERLWQRFVIHELHGRRLLAIGIGEIGASVARAAKAFGMEVEAYRRRPDRRGVPDEVDRLVGQDELTAALGRADYVVASLPLTERTRGMIGAATFAAMRPEAVFVNVGRGRTVDQAALVEALAAGRIGGAVLDVFEQEPLPADSPLWNMTNVLVSPHMCADTPFYMERFTALLLDNLGRYARGEPLRNVVDPRERY